jgi:hypothetical protein
MLVDICGLEDRTSSFLDPFNINVDEIDRAQPSIRLQPGREQVSEMKVRFRHGEPNDDYPGRRFETVNGMLPPRRDLILQAFIPRWRD